MENVKDFIIYFFDMEKILAWGQNEEKSFVKEDNQSQEKNSEAFRFSAWKKQRSLHQKSLNEKPLLELFDLSTQKSKLPCRSQTHSQKQDKKCSIWNLDSNNILMRFQANQIYSKKKLHKPLLRSLENSQNISGSSFSDECEFLSVLAKDNEKLRRKKKCKKIEILKDKLCKIEQSKKKAQLKNFSREKSLPLIRYYQRNSVSRALQENS